MDKSNGLAHDLAIFVVFMFIGILAACGYFVYADSAEELFAIFKYM
jgi:hypothetical protein